MVTHIVIGLVGVGVLLGLSWLIRKYITPPHQTTGYLIVGLLALVFLIAVMGITRSPEAP